MSMSIIWFLARIASLLLGIIALAEAIHSDTNFGPIAGLICCVFVFAFVLYAVMKNSGRSEQIFSLSSPFWPPWKYPQTYWFTTGAVLFLSAFVNLIFHLSNLAAVGLYVGILLLGLGMFTGAIFAHYQFRRRNI